MNKWKTKTALSKTVSVLHWWENKQEPQTTSTTTKDFKIHDLICLLFFAMKLCFLQWFCRWRRPRRKQERRQTVLSVKLGCSVTRIKGTETVQWCCVGGKKWWIKSKAWEAALRRSVMCGFRRGGSLWLGTAAARQNYLQKKRLFHNFSCNLHFPTLC